MSGFEVFVTSLVAVVSFNAVYDIYLLKSGKPTISEDTAKISMRAPIVAAVICLLVGILIGHFWWQMGCLN